MSSTGHVVVGLSGGVDSAVAALLLRQRGWRVTAVFMKNWEEDDKADYCAAAEDLKDARAVAEKLDIPLHTINFSSEYWDRVFSLFLAEYRAFRTPNPDVLCNREIKFRAFLEHAIALGADAIATGHYARVVKDDKACHLLRCKDENKDQTYFLYQLDQSQLRHTLFPLADLSKPEVRELAREAGLPNFERKDSTGICFIGEHRFREFLSRFLPASPGEIHTEDGRAIGTHQGLMYYTLGQRQGLGIGGVAGASEAPWFVIRKDIPANRLIVAQGHDHPALLSRCLRASQLHWIQAEAPPAGAPLLARIRHRQPLCACRIEQHAADGCIIAFDQPQRAATPGQSIVFYRDRECLGGGIIEEGYNP